MNASSDTLNILLPVALAILIILILGWLKEMRRRRERWAAIERNKKRRKPLPEGAAWVRTIRRVAGPIFDNVGTIMLVLSGDYAFNQALRLLIALENCGLDGMIGSIIAINEETRTRLEFASSLPLIFRDRITYGFTENYSSGFASKSPQEVLSQVSIWGPDVVKATHDGIDLQLRLNANLAPGLIITFISGGGHASLALPTTDILQKRFPQAPNVAITALPGHQLMRDNFPILKEAYERLGVSLWLLADNLGGDSLTIDYGIVAALMGFLDGALNSGSQTRINNVFSLASGRKTGAVLKIDIVSSHIVAFPWPDIPDLVGHFAMKQPLVTEMLNTLRRLEIGDSTPSIDLPIKEKGSSMFDLIMVPLHSRDLGDVKDTITQGLSLRQEYSLEQGNGHNGSRGRHFGQANHGLHVATFATTIDPARPICPIIGIRLSAIRDGAMLLDEIVKPPDERTPSAPKRRTLPSSNGHQKLLRQGKSASAKRKKKKEVDQ